AKVVHRPSFERELRLTKHVDLTKIFGIQGAWKAFDVYVENGPGSIVAEVFFGIVVGVFFVICENIQRAPIAIGKVFRHAVALFIVAGVVFSVMAHKLRIGDHYAVVRLGYVPNVTYAVAIYLSFAIRSVVV